MRPIKHLAQCLVQGKTLINAWPSLWLPRLPSDELEGVGVVEGASRQKARGQRRGRDGFNSENLDAHMLQTGESSGCV